MQQKLTAKRCFSAIVEVQSSLGCLDCNNEPNEPCDLLMPLVADLIFCCCSTVMTDCLRTQHGLQAAVQLLDVAGASACAAAVVMANAAKSQCALQPAADLLRQAVCLSPRLAAALLTLLYPCAHAWQGMGHLCCRLAPINS